MRREKVHGLYVLVPLRDYHLSYILGGLKLLKEKHVKNGNKAAVSYIEKLEDHLRRYFSELIKKTKACRVYVDHKSPWDPPKVIPRPFDGDIEVYVDPDYPNNFLSLVKGGEG